LPAELLERRADSSAYDAMTDRHRYRKKADQFVTAVQLNLDTDGFGYRKWGGDQRCKRGDWLVDNKGDTYSVDAVVFDKTYRRLSPGVYLKWTPIWAEVAAEAGSVATKEGRSHYAKGDYLVFNNEDGSDGYCMSAAKFDAMYEADD
jgi:hypothetical protein